MRALVTIMVLLLLIMGVSADTTWMCIGKTPQTFTPGLFSLQSNIAGEVTGVMGSDIGSTYYDGVSAASYSHTLGSEGTTSYANQLNIGKSLSAITLLEQSNGDASMREGYAQAAYSMTNITFCDYASGGSSLFGTGSVASETTLNAPVDLSYTVAMGEPANGFGRVWMNVVAMEGTNSTPLAYQDVHRSTAFIGKFSFVSSDTLRITHPFSPNYLALSKAVEEAC